MDETIRPDTLSAIEHLERACQAYETTLTTADPFWAVPIKHRCFGLLAAYDSLGLSDLLPHRQRVLEDYALNYWLFQEQKTYEESLHHSMKWIRRSGPLFAVAQENQNLIDSAGEFIMRTSSYAVAEIYRQQIRHGIHDLTYDHTVRCFYVVPTEPEANHPASSAEAELIVDNGPNQLEQQWFRTENSCWTEPQQTWAVADGRLCIDGKDTIGRIHDLSTLRQATHPDDALLVDTDQCVAGVSIGDFLVVTAALRRLSHFAIAAYLSACKDGIPQHWAMPTQVWQNRRLCKWLSSTCSLSVDKVISTLDLLKLGPAPIDTDPFLHPLIDDGVNTMWSARAFGSSHVLRNLLKRLARDPTSQNEVATLIGSRSGVLARMVGQLLDCHGYTTLCEQPFDYSSGQGDWDVIAWHPRAREQLLVIECKALLTPDSPQEVQRASNERQKAEQQLTKGIQAIEGNRDLMENRFPQIPWQEITAIFGITCMLQGLPYTRGRQNEYPVTSWRILRSISEKMFLTPQHIVYSHLEWQWIRFDRKRSGWRDFNLSNYTLKVATWNYMPKP